METISLTTANTKTPTVSRQDPIANARTKVALTLIQVEQLKSVDFPHEDPKLALAVLEKCLKDMLEDLENLPDASDAAIIKGCCLEAISVVHLTLGALRFIQNAVNVNNALEFHAPLLHLCRQLIGPSAKLILSSEWTYIPFTLPLNHPALPDFVIIGLPTSEFSNGLVFPVAGHELGHSAWRLGGWAGEIEGDIQKEIKKQISDNIDEFKKFFNWANPDDLDDLVTKQTWQESYKWALHQCEEIFCDFTGLYLFGLSFLFAFEYMLWPGISNSRDPRYPKMSRRAHYLIKGAENLRMEGIDYFSNNFVDENEYELASRKDKFLLEIADNAVANVVDKLQNWTADFLKRTGIPQPCYSRAEQIYDEFLRGVPSAGKGCLGDIISAGWLAHRSGKFLPEMVESPEKRLLKLNELVLKSVELFEIGSLLGVPDVAEGRQDR